MVERNLYRPFYPSYFFARKIITERSCNQYGLFCEVLLIFDIISVAAPVRCLYLLSKVTGINKVTPATDSFSKGNAKKEMVTAAS